MAITEKGIYYPNDYEQSADVPEDMKKMAESVEEIFKLLEGKIAYLEGKDEINTDNIETLQEDNETNKTNIANKVDKIEGKGLSTEDYTTAEKEKLANLSNYDDTEIKGDITDLQDNDETQDSEIEKLQAENEALRNQIPTRNSNWRNIAFNRQ